MIYKIKDKEVKLEFTFNSFEYMEDLDVNDMQTLDSKPFKMFGICEKLLMGAINNDPDVVYTRKEVQESLVKNVKEGLVIPKFVGELMELLEESDFFKSLQKEEETV